MNEYRFDKRVSQAIVNGILQGYKNYLEERNEKKTSMKISTAYSWVRGNHIEDQTALFCEEVGINYTFARAGNSWGYLQFTNDQERQMFIVKNGRYLNKRNITTGNNVNEYINDEKLNKNHYLYKLAQINHHIDFQQPVQLELPLDGETVAFEDQFISFSIADDELKEVQKEYVYFYIISYEIDRYGMISRIQLLLPSPVDGQAHLVEDLTPYIGTSTIDLSTVDTAIAIEDRTSQTEYPDAAWFDITTHDDQKKKNESS